MGSKQNYKPAHEVIEALIAKGETMETLSTKLGINIYTLSKYTSDTYANTTSYPTLKEKIEKAFKVPVDFFIKAGGPAPVQAQKKEEPKIMPVNPSPATSKAEEKEKTAKAESPIGIGEPKPVPAASILRSEKPNSEPNKVVLGEAVPSANKNTREITPLEAYLGLLDKKDEFKAKEETKPAAPAKKETEIKLAEEKPKAAAPTKTVKAEKKAETPTEIKTEPKKEKKTVSAENTNKESGNLPENFMEIPATEEKTTEVKAVEPAAKTEKPMTYDQLTNKLSAEICNSVKAAFASLKESHKDSIPKKPVFQSKEAAELVDIIGTLNSADVKMLLNVAKGIKALSDKNGETK